MPPPQAPPPHVASALDYLLSLQAAVARHCLLPTARRHSETILHVLAADTGFSRYNAILAADICLVRSCELSALGSPVARFLTAVLYATLVVATNSEDGAHVKRAVKWATATTVALLSQVVLPSHLAECAETAHVHARALHRDEGCVYGPLGP